MNQRSEQQSTGQSTAWRMVLSVVLAVAIACVAILLVPLPSGGVTTHGAGIVVGMTGEVDPSLGYAP